MKLHSKYLSYILRHNPKAANIELDPSGYADVDKLLKGIRQTGREVEKSDLEEIVSSDPKHRYSFNADRTKIRANYGHSVPVDLQLKASAPPPLLYHGTAEKYLDGILRFGIQKRSRNFVHLSEDYNTAYHVGERHGKAIVLKVDAEQMDRDGYGFYRSESGLWLTESVPPQYIMISTVDDENYIDG